MRHTTYTGSPMLQLAAVVAVVLLVARMSFAQCGIDSASFLYLHPYFEGKSWEIALQADVVASDSVCNLQPSSFVTTANAHYNVSAMINEGPSLLVMRSTTSIQPCLCCKDRIEFTGPVEVVVPHISLSSQTPLHVSTNGEDTNDTAWVIVPLDDIGLERLKIITVDGAIAGRDTITLASPGYSQAIKSVQAERNLAGADTLLTVGGTRGLLRAFTVTGVTVGTETVYDLDTTVTILATGGMYAASEDGAIYQKQGASFSEVARLSTLPIRAIDNSVAVGDQGMLYYNTTGGWTSTQIGTSDYHYAQVFNTAEGARVELFDDSWVHAPHAYQNTASFIASVTPVEAAAALDGSAFGYSGSDTQTVTIVLGDNEGNTAPPTVRFRSGTNYMPLTNDGTYDLPGMKPNAPCAFDTLALVNDTISLELTPNGVTLTAECEIGGVDFSCGGCVWRPYAFTASEEWAYDTLEVALGANRLLIVLEDSIATHSLIDGFSVAGVQTPGCTFDGRSLRFRFPETTRASSRSRAVLMDSRGRVLATVLPSRPIVPLSELGIASGVVHVLFELSDGARKRFVQPLAR